MPFKDIEQRRAWQREHQQPKRNQRRREQPQQTANRTLSQLSTDDLRWICIQAYGGKCACCQKDDFDIITIDHVNNDGYLETRNSRQFYMWIIKNKFPSHLQALCWNCNMAKEILGYCPHKQLPPQNILREECLNGYGGRCVRCGETNAYFLAFDHINDDGAQMRKNRDHPNGGKEFYRWLRRYHFPPIFQILCHNCNHLKEIERTEI